MKNKDTLARLLATENITVMHAATSTASFDPVKRILTLPIRTGITPEMIDMFTGHEVGHALWTDADGWVTAIKAGGRVFQGYLNVVEDARIEKLIQRKYPGLRNDFIKSYRELLTSGFFAGGLTTPTQFNSLEFIDRINVHFKCGVSAGIEFSVIEQDWIKRIAKLESWKETVTLTEELFKFAKEQKQKENDETDPGETDESEEGETETGETGEEGETETGDETDPGETGETGEEGEEGEEGETGEEGEEGEEGGTEDDVSESSNGVPKSSDDFDESEIESITDEYLRDNMESLGTESEGETSVYNLTLPSESLPIIGFKDTINLVNGRHTGLYHERPVLWVDQVQVADDSLLPDGTKLMNYGEELYKAYLAKNKAQVSYMAKEFETRKSAAEYARTQTSKSGVIDSVKMNNYRTTDDIFRRMSFVPEGKNHGFVMYLDWSGSMCEHIKPTMEQTMNLVLFCRMIGVPHRVYAFTDVALSRNTSGPKWNAQCDTVTCTEGDIMYDATAGLIELFSDKMRKSEFRDMSRIALALADVQSLQSSRRYSAGAPSYRDFPPQLSLGSTPLDDTIMSARIIYKQFKAQYNLDIVNTFFLSDGDSNACETTLTSPGGELRRFAVGRYVSKYSSSTWGPSVFTTIIDPITKKSFDLVKNPETGAYQSVTVSLMDIFRETTGGNAIGYMITYSKTSDVYHLAGVSYNAAPDLCKEMRKNGYVKVGSETGYSALFLINSKKMKTKESGLDIEPGAAKGAVKSAFRKNQRDKKFSRPMLNELVTLVA